MWPPGVTHYLAWLPLLLLGTFVQLEAFHSKCFFPGKVSDGEHCRGYFTCVQGVRVKGSCMDNQVFIAKFGKCVRIPNTLCTPKPTAPDLRGTHCEKLNAKRPYFIDCERYLRCNNFTYEEILCPPERTYSHVLGTCVYTDDVCRTSDPEEKLSFMSETDEASPYLIECETHTKEKFTGDKMDPYDCSLYFTCGVEDPDEDDIIHEDLGIIESKRCPDGELFSAEKRECEDASKVHCGDRFRDSSIFGPNPKSGRVAGRFAGRVAAPVTPPPFRLQPGRYAVRFMRLEEDGSAEVIGRRRRKKHKKSKQHPGMGRSVRRKNGRGIHMRRLPLVTKTTTTTSTTTATTMAEAMSNILGLANGGGSNRALAQHDDGGEEDKYPALATGNDEDEQPATDDAPEQDAVTHATSKAKIKNKRKTIVTEMLKLQPKMPIPASLKTFPTHVKVGLTPVTTKPFKAPKTIPSESAESEPTKPTPPPPDDKKPLKMLRSMFYTDNLNQPFGLRRGKMVKIPMILSQEPLWNPLPAGRAVASKHESTRPPCADAKSADLASPTPSTTGSETITTATAKSKIISSATTKAVVKDARNIRPIISTTTKGKMRLEKPIISGKVAQLHPGNTARPVNKNSLAFDAAPKTAKTLQRAIAVSSQQVHNHAGNVPPTMKGRFVIPLFSATPTKHTNSTPRSTYALVKGKNAFATLVPKKETNPVQLAKVTTKSVRSVWILSTALPRNAANIGNRLTPHVDNTPDGAKTTSTIKPTRATPSKQWTNPSTGTSIGTTDRPEQSKKPPGNKVNIPAIAGRGIWTRLANGAKNATANEPSTAPPRTTAHPLANIKAGAHQELGLKENQKGKETIKKYESSYHGRGAQQAHHENSSAPVKVTVTQTEAEYAESDEDKVKSSEMHNPLGKPKNHRKNHGNDPERNEYQLKLLEKVNTLLQRVDIAQGELINIEKKQQQHEHLDEAGKLVDRLSKVEPMVQKLMTAADRIAEADKNLERLAKLQEDLNKHHTSDESNFKPRGRYINVKSNEPLQKTDQTSIKLAKIEERLEQIAQESMNYPPKGQLFGLVSLGDHQYKTPLDEEQNLRLFALEQQVKNLNISVEELLDSETNRYKSNPKDISKDRSMPSANRGRMAASAFKPEKIPGHDSSESKLSNHRSLVASDCSKTESKVMKPVHMPYGTIVTPKWPHHSYRAHYDNTD